MDHRTALLFALFLSFPMAGCVDGDGPKAGGGGADLSDRLGLGLEIPETLPPRAPLQDDPRHVATLESFFLDRLPELSDRCADERVHEATKHDYFDKGYLLQSFLWFQIDCVQIPRDLEDEWVRSSMENKTEQETFDQLKERAEASIANATQKLAQITPGNGVEAQFHSNLGGNLALSSQGVRTAELYLQPYLDGQQENALQLGFVYGSLYASGTLADLAIAIMESFPWSGGSCEPPAIEALQARIQVKLDHARRLAEERGDPDDLDSIVTPYAAVVRDFPVRLEFFARHGLWPSLVGLDSTVDQHVAFFENHTAPMIPTQEEARYLVAQFRSHTHTLWTEYRLHDFVLRLEEGFYPWEQDRNTGGVWALSVPALRSPFVDLPCSPA